MENYLLQNKELWNKRTAFHVGSDFYDTPGFLKGNTSLKEIELALLGDVKDKEILHLQCHFGQDSISLARMGALVTGIDLSDKAILEARVLAEKADVPCRFIESDVYSLPDLLQQKFDVVFTSYGTIGWLPDLDRWASVVSNFLKPGGIFVFCEFHPVAWMYDGEFKKIAYSYFNVEEIIEEESGSYADPSADLKATSVTWNHPISEVLESLLRNELTLTSFKEFDYSPYKCWPGMSEISPGKFIIESVGNKLPLVYALTAQKN